MNCGTDIVEIFRIEEAIEKHGESFLNKVYTEDEISYCESHKAVKYQHYAGRFAAKEAVSKFLGTGFLGEFKLKDVEIKNNELGKPEVILKGSALKIFNEAGYKEISISISHSKEYAISMVVGYWQNIHLYV